MFKKITLNAKTVGKKRKRKKQKNKKINCDLLNFCLKKKIPLWNIFFIADADNIKIKDYEIQFNCLAE